MTETQQLILKAKSKVKKIPFFNIVILQRRYKFDDDWLAREVFDYVAENRNDKTVKCTIKFIKTQNIDFLDAFFMYTIDNCTDHELQYGTFSDILEPFRETLRSRY